MHIIKITPNSFKIILTREDLEKHGAGNIENSGISGDFFAEIIEETNRLYGSPFKEGAIDAEFFESRDGGGELFLCSARACCKSAIYILRTECSDTLCNLCRRLEDLHTHSDSALYFESGLYNLILFCDNRSDLLLSILKEYGRAGEINRLQLWLLQEHARVICQKAATGEMSRLYK